MHSIFKELHNKLQLNYQHADQLRKTTGKLIESTLQFNKDGINSAATMPNVNWAHHDKTIKEYQKSLEKSFAVLNDFATKNAGDIDRSQSVKSLANDANFIAARSSRLHKDNNNALDSVVTAAMFLQLVLDNALSYIDKKHQIAQNESASNQVKNMKKTSDRTKFLEEVAALIKDKMAMAASKHQENHALIEAQWDKKVVATSSSSDSLPSEFQTVEFQSAKFNPPETVIEAKVVEARPVGGEAQEQSSGCCPCLFFRRKNTVKAHKDETTPLLGAQKNR